MPFIKGNRHIAFIGNFQCRIEGFRHVGKQSRHFVAVFHIKFIVGKAEMVRIIQCRACRNTEFDFLCRGVRFINIMIVVRGH